MFAGRFNHLHTALATRKRARTLCASVAQLAERWSPKSEVEGSTPSRHAINSPGSFTRKVDIAHSGSDPF